MALELERSSETMIDVGLIDEPANQSRLDYDQEQLEELAESIKAQGLIQAITVEPHGERYRLLAGSRRYRAHLLANLPMIRCNVIRTSGADALAITTAENMHRANLSPLEESVWFQRLIEEHGYTPQKLALMTRKALTYITARLELFGADENIQQHVHTGKLPISTALQLMKFDDEETRKQYTEYAVSTNASLRTVMYWLQQYETNKFIPTKNDPPPEPSPDPRQPTVFGWYCYSCGNYHAAPEMQTLHVCQLCFKDIEQSKQSS